MFNLAIDSKLRSRDLVNLRDNPSEAVRLATGGTRVEQRLTGTTVRRCQSARWTDSSQLSQCFLN